MSLRIAAEHLKTRGRGPDTELVHMTKGELKGLRQLAQAHGGDLTINPDTGLPEAGFLEQVLPIVAMAAATYFTAGTATALLPAALEGTAMAGILGGAASGALIGGIGAGIQGGDVGKGALMGGIGGGITGGMGGYEGAPNLFDATQQSVTLGPQAGSIAAEKGITTEAASQMMNPNAGAGAGVSGYGEANALPNLSQPPVPQTPGIPGPTQAGQAAANLQGQARIDALNKLAEAQGAGITSTAFGNAPAPGAEQALYRAENLANPSSVGDIYKPGVPTPDQQREQSYYKQLGSSGTDLLKKAGILAAPGIAAQYGIAGTQNTGQVPTGESDSVLSRISPDFQAQAPVQPNPYYTAQYPDYRKKPYMAGGGVIAFKNQGIVDLPRSSGADVGTYTDTDANTANLDAYNTALYNMKKRANKAGMGKNAVVLKDTKSLGNVEAAAQGGIMQGHSSLGSYSDGGRLLKGPGDGMSDSIPAQIGRKQPARLADGEFVVPADVVSHLGNGSTDAGAKKLYSMMDKIRRARTGKKKQAPEVKSDKFLPA